MELKLSPMLEDDVAAVVALERDCQLSSRGEDGYLKLLQDPQWLLFVARESGNMVAIFSGLTVLDELQIDNLAVAGSHRRKGVATALLTEALEAARQKGIINAILEVRAGNFSAVELYRRQGFTAIGGRKSYYQNPPDDALLMSLTLGKHS